MRSPHATSGRTRYPAALSTALDIEALLDSSWDREHLAIYADALQGAGDLRGELVAFDLHCDLAGPQLAVRARELEKLWLGDLASELGIRSRYGFLELTVTEGTLGDRWQRMLGSSAGRYVRTLRIRHGDGRRIRRILDVVAAQERPWLTRLSVELDGIDDLADGALSAALVRALPRLRTFHLGRGTMVGFAHPGVRRLRVTGLRALPALIRPGSPFAHAVELDLSLTRGDLAVARDPLPVRRLPALRRLDLSRILDEEDVAATLTRLRGLPILHQLTHLRLPFRGLLGMNERYGELADRAGALRELQIATLPHDAVLVPSHPRVRVRPGSAHLPQLTIDSHATWTLEHDDLVLPLHAILEPLRPRERWRQQLPSEAWRFLVPLQHMLEELADEAGDGDTTRLISARYIRELLAFTRDLDDDWVPLIARLERDPDLVLTIRRAWP
ncbi:MAG: hypothetical protein ABI867_32815 [Kofleriaceae bacterium]